MTQVSTQIKGGGIKSFDLVCNYGFSWNTSVVIHYSHSRYRVTKFGPKSLFKNKNIGTTKKWSDFFQSKSVRVGRWGWGGCGWCGAGAGAGAVGSPTAPRVPRKVRPFFIHNALRLRKTKFFLRLRRTIERYKYLKGESFSRR